MKKYVNNKKTFILHDNWIPHGAEVIISRETDTDYAVYFKDLQSDVFMRKGIFRDKFVENGIASSDDMFEFESSRNMLKKSPFERIINKEYSGKTAKLLILAVDKAHRDAYSAPGSTKCLNFREFRDIENGAAKIGALEEKGSPFFNRRRRWSVVAIEEDWGAIGRPAPIGVRPEDHASLKDCNAIFEELVRQIFSMNDLGRIPDKIKKMLIGVVPNSH